MRWGNFFLAASNIYIYYPMKAICDYETRWYKCGLLVLFVSQFVFSVGQHITERNSVQKRMDGVVFKPMPQWMEHVLLAHDRLCAKAVAVVVVNHLVWFGGLTRERAVKLAVALSGVWVSDRLNERWRITYVVIHTVWHFLIYSFLYDVFSLD